MRKRLWDQEWFQDPVWRAERVNAINAHFITAFLDRYVKGDDSRAAYLDVPVARSSDGAWPAPAPGAPTIPYDAYSPGSRASRSGKASSGARRRDSNCCVQERGRLRRAPARSRPPAADEPPGYPLGCSRFAPWCFRSSSMRGSP